MQGEHYCECGCGEKTSTSARFRAGHNRRRTVDEYHVDPDTGCWVWARALNREGYGHIWDTDQKRVRRAHRVFYERHIGPIPDGLVIDHLCDNKACVNPDHLEAVTDAANLRRGPLIRLTERDAEALRRLAGLVVCSRRELSGIVAPIYDVRPDTIRGVLYGTKWLEPKRRASREQIFAE